MGAVESVSVTSLISQEDLDDVRESVAALSASVASAAAMLRMKDAFEPFSGVLLSLQRDPMPALVGMPAWLSSSSGSPVSSRSVVADSIARIEVAGELSCAWLSLDKGESVQRAKALDEEQARGCRAGLLQGVPIGIKDMFDRRGRVARWGSAVRDHVAPANRDATIVTRLEGEGGVLIGALHMAEFAMSPTGLNDHLGHGRNPHQPDHVSGGSSSGAGMAVGAGHVPLAIGSDTGGSVRLPAALCGVTGLKPTQFRVSVFGAMPLSPSLDCIGPLAVSADLCGAALAAMAGPDPLDLSCVDLPFRDGSWRGRAPADFTVALPRLEVGDHLSAEMLAVVSRVRGVLSEAGVRFVEVPLPDLALYGQLGSVLLAAESTALHRDAIHGTPQIFGRQVRRRLSRGLLMSGMDYFDAQRLRAPLLRVFMRDILGGADALMLPTTPAGAPRIQDTIGNDHARLEREFAKLSYWTRGINYLGLPALSLPAGTDQAGLPLGVQFVGAPFDEERILALGHIAQSLPDWQKV
ncbi:MAG: aspartyl-tRNA(Asn)/glutamyl-tRNA(Gln) amidotransferase subunit [Thauera sp.]|jgi:aspartyl-tRNA(Asn)/glutamyl-tRNA(Gln) amidotransferase subunit A|nr:amidase [Thauera sp.]MDI3492042.1 aspartyl-tRNA(Asn)/glutamyl-tRNA(Gln) amidotransferase subunit [Thauera sp.]